MNLKTKRWLYGLLGGFIGGVATVFDSSLALMVIAPDKFNLGPGLQTTLLTACVLAGLSGAKIAFAYLKQAPLPPMSGDTAFLEKPKEQT